MTEYFSSQHLKHMRRTYVLRFVINLILCLYCAISVFDRLLKETFVLARSTFSIFLCHQCQHTRKLYVSVFGTRLYMSM